MDRISDLPDEVVYNILSFLSTKEAALTSLLSKRWRNLFAFSSNLCFEDEYGELVYGNLGLDISRSFSDFVDRVLSVSDGSPLKKFTLKCREGDVSAHINLWICNVLNRGVMDLVLRINSRFSRSPPLEVFTCKTLVRLRLGIRFEIDRVPENASLPALKTLFLDHVVFSNSEDKGCAFEALISACPALEELELVYMISPDVNVSSGSLKTLTIINGDFSSISFDTPSLVNFDYDGYIMEDFPLFKMGNLFKARIRLLDGVHIMEDFPLAINVGKLMNGIRNVQYLYLAPETLKVLSLCSESIPVFNNLKSLAVESEQRGGWQAMPIFLRNSPNLETLVIADVVHHVTDKCVDACKLNFSFLGTQFDEP